MIDGLSAEGQPAWPPAKPQQSRFWVRAALRRSPRAWTWRSRPDCGTAFRAARWRSKPRQGRARRRRCRASGPARQGCAPAPTACFRPVRAGVRCPWLLASSGSPCGHEASWNQTAGTFRSRQRRITQNTYTFDHVRPLKTGPAEPYGVVFENRSGADIQVREHRKRRKSRQMAEGPVYIGLTGSSRPFPDWAETPDRSSGRAAVRARS